MAKQHVMSIIFSDEQYKDLQNLANELCTAKSTVLKIALKKYLELQK